MSEQAPLDPPSPPANDGLAALMASPEFQAQMAALTQQAAAQAQVLAEALRRLDGQVPPPPPPNDDVVGLAMEPAEQPVFLMPADGGGDPPLGLSYPMDQPPALPAEALAPDMLAVLPQPAPSIEAAPPVGNGASDDSIALWTPPLLHERAGAEAGTA